MEQKKQKENRMEMTSISISKNLARRLNIWKHQLDAANVEEVLNRVIRIPPASELERLKRK